MSTTVDQKGKFPTVASDNAATPVAAIAMSPNAIRYVSVVASRVAKKHNLEFEDLYQEGMCAILELGKDCTRGYALKLAAYAIHDYAAAHRLNRRTLREAAKVWNLMRRTTRTFEGLEACLSGLPPFEEHVMRLWLEGKSNTRIAKMLGTDHQRIKRTVNKSSGQIAKCLGRQLHVAHLWPVISTGLPIGVRCQRGRFVASAGAGGKVYLGTFDTVEDATEARRQYMET
jgi:RNA polymerase sigma factor (sigma-70 family)